MSLSGESTYRIRPAVEGDIGHLIGLRTEAEQWLRDRQIRQWTEDYHDYARTVLRAAVQTGAAWIVDNDTHAAIATISLTGPDPDPDFWEWADDQPHALYIGKMIVARAYAGRDIGAALLNWASQRAAAAGKQWIRLDCRRDNLGLQKYYLTRGFTHLRIYHAPGRRTESGWLAQRPAGSITATVTEIVEASRFG